MATVSRSGADGQLAVEIMGDDATARVQNDTMR
jgi:hypothetical protein